MQHTSCLAVRGRLNICAASSALFHRAFSPPRSQHLPRPHASWNERNEHLSGTVTAAGRVNALRLRIRMGGIGWPKRFWYWTMIYKFADDCRHTAPLPTRRSRSCHGAGGHSDLQTARRANPSLSHGRYATGEVRNSSCAGSTRITSGHAGALYLRNTPGRLDKA